LPDEKTHGDSVRWYLSGATSDGEEQRDPNLSLGNYRSSVEVVELAYEPFSLLPGITIERLSGGIGPGDSSLEGVPPNLLRFKRPGGEFGVSVPIATGETKIVEDRDSEGAFLRVHRWGTNDLNGTTLIRAARRYNNVAGSSNVLDADRSAGVEKVRAIFAKCESVDPISLSVWINPLAPPVVSDQDYLPVGGVGTIETSSSLSLFPRFGYARVVKSDGNLREIVFYSSDRSSGKLNVVDANHRGLLGTSPSAGAFDDEVYPVPGLRIAGEASTPVIGGSISIATDEHDVPPLSWGTPSMDNPITLAALTTDQQVGLWFRLSVPPIAGSTYYADESVLNSIRYSLIST